MTAQGFPAGTRILARDEEWLVRTAVPAACDDDGYEIRAIGVTELVQGFEIVLFSGIDEVTVLRPEDTVLVCDDSPTFRRSRLFLEAVLRRTPLPRSATGLAMADRFLLDPLGYQQRPAEMALAAQRPRLLLADVVGLGKTLEIALTLAELIRRGRADRILVVTPQHILEQFQHELWTRFSIPLVRLDSVGIERIQREIPAGRNPFTYFRRVIISIDTLKNAARYGHHLDQITWDVVVIDESHNIIGTTTNRNRLARRLADTSEALLLASATPHNGDKASFAELIRLLDRDLVLDPKTYTARDIAHLYLRRTKISPEVRDQIGDRWAEREDPVPVYCQASPEEEKVFAELATTWLAGASGPSGLFAYTLLKAHLSSPAALVDTVKNRLAKSTDAAQRTALSHLRDLADAVTSPSKLAALVDQVKAAGVGPGRPARVVVFSERVATLEWLARVVPQRIGLSPDAVRLMHGGCSDTEQQRYVEEFSLAGSPVRLLFTGDIASEGVNLHRECHTLIHYDIPWSLIRIEQRNGRIDRYGQKVRPQFRALLLTTSMPGAKDDLSVAEVLLRRENSAHRSIGTAEGVTGLFDPKREEDRLVKDLLLGLTAEESVNRQSEPDVLAELLAGVGTVPSTLEPLRTALPSLFASTREFVMEALREVYCSPTDDVDLADEDGVLALTAPDDLIQRLSDLPRSYLAAQRVNDRLRLRLTFDKQVAQRSLDMARKSDTTVWPQVAYVSDIHPVVEWLVDKVLIRLGRQEAPVLSATVTSPLFVMQAVASDEHGRAIEVSYLAIDGLPDRPRVRSMVDALAEAKVGPRLANPGQVTPPAELQVLLPQALTVARDWVGQTTPGVGEPLLRVLAVVRSTS